MKIRLAFISIILLTIYGVFANLIFLPRLFLVPTIVYLVAWLLLLRFAIKAKSKAWLNLYQVFWIISISYVIFAALTSGIPDSWTALILIPGYFLFLLPMSDILILPAIFFSDVEQYMFLLFTPIHLTMNLLGFFAKRNESKRALPDRKVISGL